MPPVVHMEGLTKRYGSALGPALLVPYPAPRPERNHEHDLNG